jgi:GAF domain-containing protein
MTDAARIEQLEAELRQAREAHAAEAASLREQQDASADILRIIASTTNDAQPVLDAIASSAMRLGSSPYVVVGLRRGDHSLVAATAGSGLLPPVGLIEPLAQRRAPMQAMAECRTIVVADTSDAAMLIEFPDMTRPAPYTTLSVPLVRESESLGLIHLGRDRAQPYSPREIRLIEAFADQAVIALENARLFQELERRNHDLSEALEQQTGTADVLRMIAASPTDARAVFETIVQTAVRLCGASYGVLWSRQGDLLRCEAAHGHINVRPDPTMPLDRTTFAGRAVLDGAVIMTDDIASVSEEEYPGARLLQRRRGHRAALAVPLRRAGEAIGSITLARLEPRPFSDSEVRLVETFADQAVIGIETTRLFGGLQARTVELGHALEQQTTMGEVLRLIASVPSDVQPVLDAVVERACRMSRSTRAALALRDGEVLSLLAWTGSVSGSSEPHELVPVTARRPGPTAVREGRTLHFPDLSDPSIREAYPDNPPHRWTPVARLYVPLMHEDRAIGLLQVARDAPQGYTASEIQLVETFADQAVIAIENARLFRELQEANRQLAEASRHKSQFLANMSHELRTPLNAIIGYTEMLQEEAEETDAEAFLPDLQKINAAGKHLLGLINDILDLSNIEAGRLDLDLTTF